MLKALIVLALLAIGAVYLLRDSEVPIPKPTTKYWGNLNDKSEDKRIRSFQINVPQEVIDDLNTRLDRTREFTKPLEGAAWTYGISTDYLKTILKYWRNDYKWSKRQALLNKYPHFKTDILGLTIHFQHIKPTIPKGRNLKVFPMLLVHGWPGSIVEFQKIIPLLTTPRPDVDFVFEVIAPSLPGYGFSDAAVRPGMGISEMATIFQILMNRLGHDKYYTQGGDWGSAITSMVAAMFPENVLGSHLNMCMVLGIRNSFWEMVGSFIPSLVVSEEHKSKMYPISHHWCKLMEETGYMHIQATKPDTIGAALTDSPSALAAYILEKFSTWTNPEYKFRDDGGLLEKFTMDELLDNVMIYWITSSITSSNRLYAESFTKDFMDVFRYNLEVPVKVPTACAAFPHELAYQPESLVSDKLKNIIQFNHMARGGHFAAFEEPKLLADDFFQFVGKHQSMLKQDKKIEL